MSLAEELIDRWAPVLVAINLITSDKGRFLVRCDGVVIFDKRIATRHALPGEIVEQLGPTLGPPLAWR